MTSTKSRQRISDFQEFVNSNTSNLREIAQASWNKVNFQQREERVIYEFLANSNVGTNFLNQYLAPIVSGDGRTVKFVSIFLHQVPMVYWVIENGNRASHACELGDLQMVFLYLSSDKTVRQCRSVIFQAKMNVHAHEHVIDHPDQRRLYDEGAGFGYKSLLGGALRRLPKGQDRERALQYLFVGSQPVRARTIPSNIGDGAFMGFGEMLVRLLNDSTGLAVVAKPGRSYGWSRIFKNIVAEVAFSANAAGQIRSSDLRGLLNHFNSFEDRSNYFLDVPTRSGVRQEGQGYGLILAIISDEQLETERTPLPSVVKPRPGNSLSGPSSGEQHLLAKQGLHVPESSNWHEELTQGMAARNITALLMLAREATTQERQKSILNALIKLARSKGLAWKEKQEITIWLNNYERSWKAARNLFTELRRTISVPSAPEKTFVRLSH